MRKNSNIKGGNKYRQRGGKGRILRQYEIVETEQYGFSREKIFISGSSAGAHLAAMAMIRLRQINIDRASTIVKGSVLMSGIYDLRPLLNTYVNDPLELNERRACDLSPMLLNLEALPDLIVCWGENETAEFKRQSRDFALAHLKAGGDCQYFEIPDCNHFDLVHQLENIRIDSGRLIFEINK